MKRPWLFANKECLCYSCCIPFARIVFFGAIGTECIRLRTNGSVKISCRLNFNLHGEWFYYCYWFTDAKCLTSSGIFRLLRGLFVPERSETRSKISSVLVRSASPENETKGECKSCDSKTVQLGNACLRYGWQHAGSYSVPFINGWHRQRVMVHFEHQQPCTL